MRYPNLSCKIEIQSLINPSEDPKKIETAILNIFPDVKIKTEEFFMISYTKDLHLLEKILNEIHSKHLQKIYQRQLDNNLKNDSTWFYINKQAAFVGKIVLCEEGEESPLGPIKVKLISSNINLIIDWIAEQN